MEDRRTNAVDHYIEEDSTMKFLKKLAAILSLSPLVIVPIWGAVQISQASAESIQVEVDSDYANLAADAEYDLIQAQRELYAFRDRGDEYVLIKQAIIEEIGAHPDEWELVFAAIVVGRVESELFTPDTVEGILKQKFGSYWQFSYMGDKIHPMITDELGDRVDAVMQPLWVAYVHGEYVSPIAGLHSFCVAAACDGEKAKQWFGRLQLCATMDGHEYYCGEPQYYAPTTSVRPTSRSTPDPLILALMEAN